jgi:3-oxoacyl-[acyl-carrier protein] reductase
LVIEIKGKTALIMGGSGGIGSETARMLLDKGMKVLLSYHSEGSKKKAEAWLKDFPQGCSFLFRTDVRDEKRVADDIGKLMKKHGKIDAVVYSVSSPIVPKAISEMSWSDFQLNIETQIKGFFSVVKSVMPLIKDGHKMRFVAVITEACFGKPPGIKASDYITSKYGLIGLVKCMASELGKGGCTFNMVSPGMVDTKLLSKLPPKLVEFAAMKNPMKRNAEPHDVASVICFLLSDEAGYLNGVNIMVNGGEMLS